MNEPQVWTMMGLFGASMFSMLAVVSGLFTQVIRAEVGKVGVGIEGLSHRIEGLDKRMDGLDTRMDRLDTRFDALDRDVQAIARRVFPEPE